VSSEFSFLDSVSAFDLVISTHTSGSSIGTVVLTLRRWQEGPYKALFRIRRKTFVHFIADFGQKKQFPVQMLETTKSVDFG
jgi:hypothetical protein